MVLFWYAFLVALTFVLATLTLFWAALTFVLAHTHFFFWAALTSPLVALTSPDCEFDLHSLRILPRVAAWARESVVVVEIIIVLVRVFACFS